jgi:hypothetical protein
LEVAEGLVDLEDEWGGEGIEGLGAVELDLGAWVRYSFFREYGAGNILKPTPGLASDTSRCSNDLCVAYPLRSLGRPVDWN